MSANRNGQRYSLFSRASGLVGSVLAASGGISMPSFGESMGEGQFGRSA